MLRLSWVHPHHVFFVRVKVLWFNLINTLPWRNVTTTQSSLNSSRVTHCCGHLVKLFINYTPSLFEFEWSEQITQQKNEISSLLRNQLTTAVTLGASINLIRYCWIVTQFRFSNLLNPNLVTFTAWKTVHGRKSQRKSPLNMINDRIKWYIVICVVK